MTSMLFSQSKEKSDIQMLYSEKQIAFSHLSIDDGLSQNSVISMAQDSIGYMWFATQDGLNKYDGNSFKVYGKQFEDITRPTFSRLGKIYIDKKNKLWIITNSGKLELYQPEIDSFITIKQFKDVSAIFQDQNFNTYIGTYGKGLFKIDAVTNDTIQLFKPKDLSRISYAFHQLNNEVIIATSGAIFSLKKDNSYQNLIKKGNSDINYSTITQTQNNKLWFGSYGYGLFYKNYNENSVRQYIQTKEINIPKNLNIEDLLVDDKNRLWIATYGNGAYLLDFKQNKLTNFLENKTNPFAIHYNDMLSLHQDNTGTVWLGSDGAGASYYDEHLVKFNVLTNKQMPKSVNIDVVRSIASNSDDNMWIGTSGKGLTFIDTENNIYKTLSTNNTNLSSNRIISLSFQDNTLWIGHQGYGLNLLTSKGTIQNFPEISNYTIWRIIPHSENQSWLCTESNGLVLFDKNLGVVERYNTTNSSITSNNIKTIVRDENEDAWIGTENQGVFQLNFKNKEITKLTALSDPIKSLLYLDNILWVGTFGKGLKKYNTKNKEIISYSTEDGLPNNVIYGILPDDNGNLWLSTNIGLSKFSINNISDKPTFENYSNYDGLQALEFNTGAYYKSPNGTLYFGGLEGVNWFHPNQLTQNTVKPKTVISGLELFNKPIDKIENQTFKHSENTLTFIFSSLHFSQPERNKYRYKLINNDNDWINAGNNHIAHYTNLPPNTYEFQVISSNYDGIWNDTPETYNFTILKPWYLNNSAKLVYLLLLILLGYLIYRYFKWRWLMKLQLELEHTETVRLKELDEFKTKLYTNISHEFRTPLTLILGPTENQLAKKNISNPDKKELSLIKRNAKRLLNLVNQLMDLSRLETGHLKLNVEKDNLGILLKQLASSFQYKAKEKNIDFKTEVSNISDAWFDKDIVEKIVTNLLANAVKYTPKKERIYFKTEKQDNYAIITIINSGSTIKPDDLGKLFTRFYQVNSNADGVGIGLAIVKELVALTHGTLMANTINTDEIQFTVTLPINREAFKVKDINTLSSKIDNYAINNSIQDSSEKDNIENDKPVILIVEDDKQIRAYMASILEANYKVIKAPNGKIGIKKALDVIPDLIISDIMMPTTNGIELCEALKNNMLTSHIPIILLTAKVGEENELKGLEVGADDFITKPFKSKILLKRIDNLIQLRKSLQSRYSQYAVLKSKDLAITTLDEDFLNKVETVLEKHLSDPNFNAVAFSKLMLASRMQLHRKLVALTGLTTTNFLRSQRLKLAVSLLQKSDYTVAEIAYQVGFNTPSYFNKCFKKAYNCTPYDYISRS